MSKTSLIFAGAVGYVLGARAGKERYADIKTRATQFWQDPRVQEKKDQAQDLVKEKAPKVQDKMAEVAQAASKGKRASGGDKNPSDDLPSAPSSTASDFTESTPAGDSVGGAGHDTHV